MAAQITRDRLHRAGARDGRHSFDASPTIAAFDTESYAGDSEGDRLIERHQTKRDDLLVDELPERRRRYCSRTEVPLRF